MNLEQELNTINILYYADTNSIKTIQSKTNELLKVFKKKSLKNFKQEDITKYILLLKHQNNKPSTINSKLAYLSKCLNYYGNKLKIPYQKISSLEQTILNKNDIDKITSQTTDKELIQFILIAYYTGLRASEILSINKSLIKYIDNTYFISILNTKNKHNNYIPINKVLNQVFDSFIDWNYNYKQIYYLLSKFNIHPHQFRHSFITRCFEQGLDSFTIMKLVNQTSLNSTQKYVHLQNKFLINEVNKITI